MIFLDFFVYSIESIEIFIYLYIHTIHPLYTTEIDLGAQRAFIRLTYTLEKKKRDFRVLQQEDIARPLLYSNIPANIYYLYVTRGQAHRQIFTSTHSSALSRARELLTLYIYARRIKIKHSERLVARAHKSITARADKLEQPAAAKRIAKHKGIYSAPAVVRWVMPIGMQSLYMQESLFSVPRGVSISIQELRCAREKRIPSIFKRRVCSLSGSLYTAIARKRERTAESFVEETNVGRGTTVANRYAPLVYALFGPRPLQLAGF